MNAKQKSNLEIMYSARWNDKKNPINFERHVAGPKGEGVKGGRAQPIFGKQKEAGFQKMPYL